MSINYSSFLHQIVSSQDSSQSNQATPINMEYSNNIVKGIIMIEIMNLRYDKPSQPWDVKVDRSSVLGNPFPMKGEAQRNAVCEKICTTFGKRNNLRGANS